MRGLQQQRQQQQRLSQPGELAMRDAWLHRLPRCLLTY